MKKKIIITVLGLLGLMSIQVSANIFVFDKGTEGILLSPIWVGVYVGYLYMMVKRIYWLVGSKFYCH